MRNWWIGIVASGAVAHAEPASSDSVGAQLVTAAHNGHAAVRALFADRVTNGGVWFEDAACRAKFAAPGKLDPDQLDAFAACLAKLPLQVSTTRIGSLTDATVVVYKPGIELEAVFTHGDRHALRWIGLAGFGGASDTLPTITAELLEAHRTAGSPAPRLDAATRATLDRELSASTGDDVYAWVKVCLDDHGAVASVSGRQASSVTAESALTATIKDWMFKPIELGGHAAPVCSVIRLAYPDGKTPPPLRMPIPPPPPPPPHGPPAPQDHSASRPMVVPPNALAQNRVKGNTAIEPDDPTKIEIRKAKLDRVVASLKLCVDVAGKVESVTLLKSSNFEAYDAKLSREIAAWEYSPYQVDGHPVPVCTAVTFVYTQH
jgi:hypothetical protein